MLKSECAEESADIKTTLSSLDVAHSVAKNLGVRNENIKCNI
jgi:hypothetical protein